MSELTRAMPNTSGGPNTSDGPSASGGPNGLESRAEAQQGDVEALAGLLSGAMERHGFLRFREQQAAIITDAAQEAQRVPPAALSWRHLAAVEAEDGGAAALAAWESVRRAARTELASGHRAAMVMEGAESSPMDRARFLAVWEALAAEWQPRGGIEWSLIDAMAQAQAAHGYWLGKLTERTQREVAEDVRDREKLSQQEQYHRWGEWLPARVTTAEAIAEASGMVDRFNRVFLRTLRQLRDLRRYSPVVINNPGQVNVGGQQVNVSQQEGKPAKARRTKRRRRGFCH